MKNGENNDPNGPVTPPVKVSNVKNQAEQEKIVEQSLHAWSRKAFGEKYDPDDVSRAWSAVKGTGHFAVITPETMVTSGFCMYFGLAMLFQIALEMSDKKLAAEFKKSEVKKFVDWTVKYSIDLTDYNFESVLNNLSKVASGKDFENLSTPNGQNTYQGAIKSMKTTQEEFNPDELNSFDMFANAAQHQYAAANNTGKP